MGLFRKEPELLDPHELGMRRSDPALGALEPLPPGPPRIAPLKLLAYFAIGVVVVAVLRDGVGGGAPAVTGSCTMPAFALNKESIRSNGALKWSATGPADATVVIGLDTTSVPSTREDGKLSGPTALKDCKADGLFGVRAPDGRHQVTAYLVKADGTSSVVSTSTIIVEAQ